ncbi:MAG: endopeptidase La [Gammaproteobacteria bacterium]|nr:endopeptidase La [Gammaproteobacteria bacterium]
MAQRENRAEQDSKNIEIPILPLRDVVVYPHMVIPLFVGREKSIKALEAAMESDKQIFLGAQKVAVMDDPKQEDIYDIGTLSTILQLLKLPDGTIKVLVEGSERAIITDYLAVAPYFLARVDLIPEIIMEKREAEVLMRSVMTQFDQYVKLNNRVPPELLSSLGTITDPGRLADTIAAHMTLKIDERQEILELIGVNERLEKLMGVMTAEIDLLQVEKRIRGRVKRQMEKSQREYYLNEQMKAIQKELGELEDVPNEVEELTQKIEKSGMGKEAKTKAKAELNKLKMMAPMSAEATVVRNYLDWMVNVPWKKRSKVRRDLVAAEQVLEDDHYGLEKVKERILEYLAVQQRVDKLKGPVLCLVGPPGVGKTSLGRSIARATNRKFVRMALGGVRDEAEIRGHRRTYIGSMPGKLIQNLSKVGVKNPLFLLDEVDKMSNDFRGDPSSALLEVLDPEQNNTFADHYLEVDYDLSDVMFIATANSMNIPGPLLDRMEVIRLSGYTEEEKVNIAIRYLVPKQLKAAGLAENEMSINEDAIRDIVRYYTREAGVRGLDREISKLCRKVVRRILLSKAKKNAIKISSKNIEEFLGVKRFRFGRAEENDQIGQVTGLAWTEVGGELLTIEAAVTAGKGKLTITGQLGDVMQESIQAAMTVVRSRAATLGIQSEFYQENDIHIHVPEGAIPKDGPSAGVGMCTALVSVLTGIPVKSDVAMTGEITLRGQVLPIGGLKEKLLAAHRGGIKTVLIPEDNERDLAEIPEKIKQNLNIQIVKWIDDVLQLALQSMPEPLIEEDKAAALAGKESVKKNKERGRIRPH